MSICAVARPSRLPCAIPRSAAARPRISPSASERSAPSCAASTCARRSSSTSTAGSRTCSARRSSSPAAPRRSPSLLDELAPGVLAGEDSGDPAVRRAYVASLLAELDEELAEALLTEAAS